MAIARSLSEQLKDCATQSARIFGRVSLKAGNSGFDPFLRKKNAIVDAIKKNSLLVVNWIEFLHDSVWVFEDLGRR